MRARHLIPILNVSDIGQSFEWFENLGWKKNWEWGSPPGFGSLSSGSCTIFLCLDCQGGRGKSPLATTAGEADAADQGVWMSIWVDDVDALHAKCVELGYEITHPPTDEEWMVREMHVRHPDGHVFRMSQAFPPDQIDEDDAPLPVERVDVPVRLERRLAALLVDLAEQKGLTVSGCLEESLLHSFERVGEGVASPHTEASFDYIEELKETHGIDYDTHASYRFVEG